MPNIENLRKQVNNISVGTVNGIIQSLPKSGLHCLGFAISATKQILDANSKLADAQD